MNPLSRCHNHLPMCERNFIDAVNGNGNKMKVYDIIELVQQAI